MGVGGEDDRTQLLAGVLPIKLRLTVPEPGAGAGAAGGASLAASLPSRSARSGVRFLRPDEAASAPDYEMSLLPSPLKQDFLSYLYLCFRVVLSGVPGARRSTSLCPTLAWSRGPGGTESGRSARASAFRPRLLSPFLAAAFSPTPTERQSARPSVDGAPRPPPS